MKEEAKCSSLGHICSLKFGSFVILSLMLRKFRLRRRPTCDVIKTKIFLSLCIRNEVYMVARNYAFYVKLIITPIGAYLHQSIVHFAQLDCVKNSFYSRLSKSCLSPNATSSFEVYIYLFEVT